MRTWRVAIAGLGRAAREIHLPAYAPMRQVKLVAGCDPRKITERFSFPVFTSVDDMLDSHRPDIVVVATPPDSHFEVARAGLEAGCHIFCEKPFMPEMTQAIEITELARSTSRAVVVNNQYRCMNIFRAAQELIGSDRFGHLLFASFHQTFTTDSSTEEGWRGEDKRRTCQDFGIHVLDLCRFLFAQEPLSICARMPRPGDPDGPDLLNLIQVEFPGDRAAQITLDRLSRGRHRYLACRLDGSRAAIESEIGGGIDLALGIRGGKQRRPYVRFQVVRGGQARLYSGEKSRRIATDPLDIFARATRRLMRSVLTALDAGETPPSDGEDNLKSLALMLAAYESDRTRSIVRLS